MAVGQLILLILGVVLLAGIVVTIASVAKGRPPQPPQSEADRVRFTPRSMRGFNTMMMRDVRRGSSGGSSRRPGRPKQRRSRRRSG